MQQRLNSLKERFSSIPEGRELLELAENNGCAIVFKPELPDHLNGLLHFTDRTLYLNPSKDDDIVLDTMAHELRHVWQAIFIDPTAANFSSVPYIFIYKRLIEGDAITFAAQFMEKLKSPEKQIDIEKMFMDFQTSIAEVYDQRILAQLKNVQARIDSGTLDQKSLTDAFNYASAPHAPDENLLRLTVHGLSEDNTKYLDFKTMREMTDTILPHIPQETLQTAQALVADIKKSAKFQMGL